MAKVTMLLKNGTEVEAEQHTPAAVLIRILRAHESGNNGAYMGEASLCAFFEDMAEHVLAEQCAVDQEEKRMQMQADAISRRTFSGGEM